MKRAYGFAGLMIVWTAASLLAQVTGDVIGVHDLGPGEVSRGGGAARFLHVLPRTTFRNRRPDTFVEPDSFHPGLHAIYQHH